VLDSFRTWFKRNALTTPSLIRLYLIREKIHPFYLDDYRASYEFYKELDCNRSYCLEIGANNGQRTRGLLAAGFKKVIAVDPNPLCVQILRYRFRQDPRVVVVESGVGDEVGQLPLYLSDYTQVSSFRSDWNNSSNAIVVPMLTLDRLLSEYGVPDYLKIDVEGYELKVLSTLSTPISLISIEMHLAHKDDILHCLEKIRKLGDYKCKIVEMLKGRWIGHPWIGIRDLTQKIEEGNVPAKADIFLRLDTHTNLE